MKSKKILLVLVSVIVLALTLNVKSYATDGNDIGSPGGSSGAGSGNEVEGGKGEESTVQWPDFANAKVEFELDSTAKIKIKISNITLDEGNFTYKWEISSTNANLNSADVNNDFGSSNGELIINDMYVKKFYPKADDMYLTVKVIHKTTKQEKNVLVAKKLDRLEQKSLGNRIEITISNTSVSFVSKEPTGDNRKLNTKIGIVTDKDLLSSIGKNESGWRQKLLDYAKKATPINEGTVDNASSFGFVNVDTNLDLVDGAYYFIYIGFDDENGTYIPIEDVAFCQAIVSPYTGSYLTTDWKMDDPVEDPTPTPSPSTQTPTPSPSTNNKQTNDPTVSNSPLPKTGEGIAIFIAIVTIVIVAIVTIKKYSKYKDI